MMKFFFSINLFLFFINGISSQNTILWKISNNNSFHTSYLLGSFHSLGNHFIDSLPIIKDLLLKSDLAIFECIDGDKTVYDRIVNRRVDNFSYRKELEEEYIFKLDSISKYYKFPIEKYKPHELLVKLQNIYTLTHCDNILQSDKWNHFDDYLSFLALKNDVKKYGLETNHQQVKFFKKSIKTFIYQLTDDIIDENNYSTICIEADKYKNLTWNYKFDLKSNKLYFTNKRNCRWMNQIPDKLNHYNCFIVVGIAHLESQTGLIYKLRELGYLVEPIKLR